MKRKLTSTAKQEKKRQRREDTTAVVLSLQSLPDIIIARIFKHLSPRDRLQCYLVSKVLTSLLETEVIQQLWLSTLNSIRSRLGKYDQRWFALFDTEEKYAHLNHKQKYIQSTFHVYDLVDSNAMKFGKEVS